MLIHITSDTHGRHEELKIPDVDMVIHCGDHSNHYDPFVNELELRKSLSWFESLPIRYKLSTMGNHDCYHKDTLFLTNKGYIRYEEVDCDTLLATFDNDTNITFEKYTSKFDGYADDLIEMCSSNTKQMVTKNHNIFYKNSLCQIDFDTLYNSNHFSLSGIYDTPEYDILDEELKLINFILSDATIVFKENKHGKYLSRIQFKLSKERKIKEICEILESLGIKYTKKPCKKYGVNKLDPFYIRIYGNEARDIYKNLLLGEKEIPPYFRLLSPRQKKLFLDYFIFTDGSIDDNNAIIITTINEQFAKNIVELCVLSGYDSYYKEYGKSGFSKGNKQYQIRVCRNRLNGRGLKIKPTIVKYNDKVVCFSVPSKKLITMFNGRIAFSGNSSFKGGNKSLVKPEEYPGITFLMHESKIIDGIKFFGSPYSPVFGNWSFTYKRNKGLQVWDCIPKDCDVIFTHTMPKGILDLALDFDTHEIIQVGCKSLYNKIMQTKASYFFGGHLHSTKQLHNNGILKHKGKTFVNAACLNHETGEILQGHTIQI